ncbi:MAG: hypothetical protein RL133_373, partial [Pseudomonadota bacterium]
MRRVELLGVELVGHVVEVSLQNEPIKNDRVLGHEVKRDIGGNMEGNPCRSLL